jgi:23S rRNA pseudouridine2605 synthase
MERDPQNLDFTQESNSSENHKAKENHSEKNSENNPNPSSNTYYKKRSDAQGQNDQPQSNTYYKKPYQEGQNNQQPNTYYKKPYNNNSYNQGNNDQQQPNTYYKKPYQEGQNNQQQSNTYYKKPYNNNSYNQGNNDQQQPNTYYKKPYQEGQNDQQPNTYYKKPYQEGQNEQPNTYYKKPYQEGQNEQQQSNTYYKKPSGYQNNQQGSNTYYKKPSGYQNNNNYGGYNQTNQGQRQNYNQGGGNYQRRDNNYTNNRGGYQPNRFNEPLDTFTNAPVLPNDREDQEGVRINKYIAHAGLCARRKADDFIRQGRIYINGEIMNQVGYRVKPTDVVTVDGANVKPTKKYVYILLNKPRNVISTSEDEQGRRTVMDLITPLTEERVYPVGRLDRDTTGLVLLTNDGELAQRLAQPSHEVRKIYEITLDKPLEESDLALIRNTVTLEDGEVPVHRLEFVHDSPPNVVGMEISNGRNRIVRRLFEHLGYRVTKLDRVKYAMLTKKGLPRGKCRFLDVREINMLKYLF